MSIKIPIRTVYDNSNNAIGLSEMQTGEVVGPLHGGTGLSSLGSVGQVLQVNSGGDGFEFGNKTAVNLNPYLQVANANVNFVTKATALTTNNAIINLINDRMQVANVQSLVTTSINDVIDAAPGTLDTLNELAAAIGDDANFITTINTSLGTKASNTYVNNTFVTKSTALSSNNTLLSLINDRLQVANASATYSTLAQLGNTNSYIASVQSALDTQETKQASDLANTNSYIASVQTNINVQIGSSNTSIRSYTNQTFETKSVALAANNAQNSLILDRLQVANAASLFVNVSGDTMSGALAMGTNKITGLGTPTASTDAATKGYVDTEVANIVDAAPETLNTLNELAAALGDDANFATTTAQSLGTKASNTYVNATFATKAYAAANTYVNAQIGASNTSIRNYGDTTYVTKSTAVTSNNNLLSLINDRIQVANVASAIRPSVSTVTSNTSVDATDHNNAILINSSETVIIIVAASSGLNIGDTFKFYPIGAGDIRIDLDSSDVFLGTNLSSTQISAFSDAQVNLLQGSQIQSGSNRDFVTTGLYTKVELLYAGSGTFVLTK